MTLIYISLALCFLALYYLYREIKILSSHLACMEHKLEHACKEIHSQNEDFRSLYKNAAGIGQVEMISKCIATLHLDVSKIQERLDEIEKPKRKLPKLTKIKPKKETK